MKIMNFTSANYTNQKQKQYKPGFGMKLHFTKEAKGMFVDGAFEKISKKVANMKTIYGEKIIVKGKLNSKNDRSIMLSTEVGNRSINRIIVSHECLKSTFENEVGNSFSSSVLNTLKIMKKILDA